MLTLWTRCKHLYFRLPFTIHVRHQSVAFDVAVTFIHLCLKYPGVVAVGHYLNFIILVFSYWASATACPEAAHESSKCKWRICGALSSNGKHEFTPGNNKRLVRVSWFGSCDFERLIENVTFSISLQLPTKSWHLERRTFLTCGKVSAPSILTRQGVNRRTAVQKDGERKNVASGERYSRFRMHNPHHTSSFNNDFNQKHGVMHSGANLPPSANVL